MEAGIDAVANAESLSKSLRNVSLDDGKVFVQDGDYVIDDESSLPFECKKVLGKGWSAVVEKVECLRSKEIFANKVITFPRRGISQRSRNYPKPEIPSPYRRIICYVHNSDNTPFGRLTLATRRGPRRLTVFS